MNDIHPLVQSVLDSARLITECSPFQMNAAVSDRKRYLRHFPIKELDFKIKPDTPIPEGSMADLVIQTGLRHTRRVEAKVFGIPYIGVGVPIIDQGGEVVGCLVTGSSIGKQENTQKIANNLFASVQELAGGSQGQTNNSIQLADIVQRLTAESLQVTEDINQTDKIISIIRGVASQTQILGINASIEASRAGNLGSGFRVVAEEIRNMGNKTNSSVIEISSVLNETKRSIITLVNQISAISGIAKEQAAASEQISSALNSISAMAEDLNALAESLV